jgi:hypothetical protein
VFVAGVLHNCELWSSRIKFADAYANFFGVTCLHDGPYMAAFEGFECFQAFDDYLRVGGDDLPASVRLLLSEFWRHAQNVSWSFYPDALPPDAISKEVRNGRIDPALSFPLGRSSTFPAPPTAYIPIIQSRRTSTMAAYI